MGRAYSMHVIEEEEEEECIERFGGEATRKEASRKT
jgi:hypothetical protein